MACDICGAKGTSLADLRDGYKTSDIQQVCPACEADINKKLWKIRLMFDGVTKTLLKRFMAERKSEDCKVAR